MNKFIDNLYIGQDYINLNKISDIVYYLSKIYLVKRWISK